MSKSIQQMIDEKIVSGGRPMRSDLNVAIRELMKEYAVMEVQRFAQHLKDQGFCPNDAYSNHVQDCYVAFDQHEPMIKEG